VRDPSLIEPLLDRVDSEKKRGREQTTPRCFAVEALIDIGHQYRMTMVAEALEKAQHLQGAHATRISILIEDALRRAMNRDPTRSMSACVRAAPPHRSAMPASTIDLALRRLRKLANAGRASTRASRAATLSTQVRRRSHG
jgi:hypothetical protein